MALPEFSMRTLLEAGAHFGHQTHRWNPKMDRYIFGSRSNIHIIDLSQTMPLFHQALVAVRDVAAKGGRVLFVGTKRQASEPVAEAAKRCAQYYMNNRWLGGTLTNWRTVSGSIARLRELEGILENGGEGRVKKELLNLQREKDKLELSLGGIKDMGSIPDIMFVIDTNKEAIAIQEARKLNIPIIAILDTNAGASASGVDLGAAINPEEPMLREASTPVEADAAPAGTEDVAAELVAAAEPAVADEAAQAATSEANDAVETEKATG
ncbi:MAG: 30S ribosomal protein S2 [Brevundimonas sp. 32-68-21]|nr:MAG: 30S ribosomal protein S2 [Brevundimonas sp. 32-68-21]